MSSVFPLFFLLCSLLARLLAWLEWVEKNVSKPIGTRAPNLFLESVLFSFFFQNKKATGKNRQYWGEGVCFSFGQACLLPCPASVTTTALWGKSVAQTREEKCFSCKTAAKTMDPHLSSCHLATNLTCFPLLGNLLVFQALLCFDFVSPPFNFCLKFVRIKLQRIYMHHSLLIHFHQVLFASTSAEACTALQPILPWRYVAVIVCSTLWGDRRWDRFSINEVWGVYCFKNMNIVFTLLACL